MWETAQGERQDSGGRLELVYDDRGLQAIEGVWERLDEPWETFLAGAVETIAAGAVEDIRRVVEEPVEGVVSLTLTYVAGSGLHFDVSLNRSRDAMTFAYPYGVEYPIGEIESGVEEGFAEKAESLRACNPPERAETWVQVLREAERYEEF